LQIEQIARVILRYQQHPPRFGAYLLHRALHGLHTQRQEIGIEIIEATGKQIGVDGREFETAVAQIDRSIERHGMLQPLRAQPMLGGRHGGQQSSLQIEQGAGQGGGEMRNHVISVRNEVAAF
jgi:hypothetical protein